MCPRQLQRVLRGYARHGDSLAVELPVNQAEVNVLQRALGLPEDDPMYDCYPVGADQLRALQPYINDWADLEGYDFFLECDEV